MRSLPEARQSTQLGFSKERDNHSFTRFISSRGLRGPWPSPRTHPRRRRGGTSGDPPLERKQQSFHASLDCVNQQPKLPSSFPDLVLRQLPFPSPLFSGGAFSFSQTPLSASLPGPPGAPHGGGRRGAHLPVAAARRLARQRSRRRHRRHHPPCRPPHPCIPHPQLSPPSASPVRVPPSASPRPSPHWLVSCRVPPPCRVLADRRASHRIGAPLSLPARARRAGRSYTASSAPPRGGPSARRRYEATLGCPADAHDRCCLMDAKLTCMSASVREWIQHPRHASLSSIQIHGRRAKHEPIRGRCCGARHLSRLPSNCTVGSHESQNLTILSESRNIQESWLVSASKCPSKVQSPRVWRMFYG